MRVLVIAGSRHGSTSELATAIGAELGARGHEVTVADAHDPPGPVDGFDAAVIGSAVYMGHWTKDTRHFVEHHRAELAAMPVWLFSSGPLGDEPEAESDPAEISDMVAALDVHEHRVFAGALDREALSLIERTTVRAVKAPYGDFRDWDEVRAWADEISDELTAG